MADCYKLLFVNYISDNDSVFAAAHYLRLGRSRNYAENKIRIRAVTEKDQRLRFYRRLETGPQLRPVIYTRQTSFLFQSLATIHVYSASTPLGFQESIVQAVRT